MKRVFPSTINPDAFASLVAMAEQAFHDYGQSAAFTNMGEALSYDQLDEYSQRFAGFLQTIAHLSPGDRVAIMLPNILQYPVALLGILRAKMVVVNVNPLYTPRELVRVLNDSSATGIVVLANFAHVLEEVLPETDIKTVVVTELGDLFSPLKRIVVNTVVKTFKKMVPSWHIQGCHLFLATVSAKNKDLFRPETIKGEDIAFLQYTGGTTGGIKGAVLTHRNMVANILQAQAWIKSFLDQHKPGGIITALPLYHIFSLTANFFTFFTVGIYQYSDYQSARHENIY